MEGPSEKLHSLPNVQKPSSDLDLRQLYSLSLSQIRKREEFKEYNYKPSPFNIRWIHGYNPRVGVINLNEKGSTIAFYAAGNCAVLYNWIKNNMMFLQGHKHTVTCLSTDSAGKWLVTADSGPENAIIIWDSSDYFPQRTIFSPHRNVKLAKVTMSADAKYLLSLGYHDKATVNWWIWSHGLDGPHASLEVNIPRGGVIEMGFNPDQSEQFLLMAKHGIWIGVSAKVFVMERGILKETKDYELKIKAVEQKMNPENGRFTCFTFVKDSSQTLVATSRGAVLVYGYTIEYRENMDQGGYEKLKFIKVLKVEQRRINVIKSVDGVIVTGNIVGEIRFYDRQMKLIYWMHGFTLDCIKGISFNISPRSYKILDPKCKTKCPCWEKVVMEEDSNTGQVVQKLIKKDIQSDATTAGKPFVIRDFIVCSNNQGVGFVDFVAEKMITILDNETSNAQSVAVHPEKPYTCIGYADGTIELYNFIQHKLFIRIDLREHYKIVIPPKEDSIRKDDEVMKPQLSVTCLKYSPSGCHLACGLDTGGLVFLHPTVMTVLTETPHKDTSHSITHIDFSCDSLTLVFADKGRTVCVYKYDCNILKWNFIGKHRAHYKDITAVFFLPTKNENGEYKLLSLGTDRIMVEYDIGKSGDEYLEVKSLDRIDQTSVPLCGIPWPTPGDIDPETQRTDLPMILVATDEHKYKVINYATTMTLSTVLGPRYAHPVCRMQLINSMKDDVKYILFATKNVIGLQKMPLDGNPWKHVSLLGHPVQIVDICCREDSGSLFTIGAKDCCMYQWSANYRSVETTSEQGGVDLDPYYCLMENGRPGWLFHEIRDLFYYIQILCQGTFSPAMRRVKDYIPIDSLPDLMRALGYFPSEYEVENLIVEAKFKVYERKASTEVDFEEFVKLYLNHRPAFGDSFKKIRNAFRHFANMVDNNLSMDRDDFIDMLSNNGEHFAPKLSWYLLSILNGHSFEERNTMAEGDFSFLPEVMTFEEIATNIMGIPNYEMYSDNYSVKDSLGSQQTVSSESDEGANVNFM